MKRYLGNLHANIAHMRKCTLSHTKSRHLIKTTPIINYIVLTAEFDGRSGPGFPPDNTGEKIGVGGMS